MYKLAKGISLAMMQEILKFRNNKIYNLRSQNTFEIPFRNSLYNGNESISNILFGSKVLELVPHNLKTITSLNSFIEKINKWNPESCPCKLCLTYIQYSVLEIRHELLLSTFLSDSPKIFYILHTLHPFAFKYYCFRMARLSWYVILS